MAAGTGALSCVKQDHRTLCTGRSSLRRAGMCWGCTRVGSTGSYSWPAETDEDEILSFFKNWIHISRHCPTCITKQVRIPTQEQETTKSSAFSELSHPLFLSGCFIRAHLCTALQQERGRTYSCSTGKKQLGKANSLCKASSLQQHKPRNRIGHIKSKSKIAPSSDHLHFR